MNTTIRRVREIPYNYTSFSDKEIILKYFDEPTWENIELLRSQRKTGRSAKLLFAIIGDISIIERNPYLYENFLTNKKKRAYLQVLHEKRFQVIEQHIKDNHLAAELLSATRILNRQFFREFEQVQSERKKLLACIKKECGAMSVYFTPFHRVAHCTDATDWRVAYPFAVVYPDRASQIPAIISVAAMLNMTIIPRGGGTGLTGGAVPLQKNTIVINTERLTNISPVHFVHECGKDLPVITAEAGVVTDIIMEHCEQLGYVFATDPTSAWASTIGGNIAENAGGKKCVMWGTAIDNIYAFTIANYQGNLFRVQRDNHPGRKISPQEKVQFSVYAISPEGTAVHPVKTIVLPGNEIRKTGLGKDITNKALGGLPGVQKEGGDGIILSAEFVLYKPFAYNKTLCIEFFGKSMQQAAQAIVAINKENEVEPEAFLTALEHFDEKYVDAINYRNKSNRTEKPKAVLLIDIESNSPSALEQFASRLQSLLHQYNAEGIFAGSTAMQKAFWMDRKHLGAIARHTNAFKLNEDVVIPIEKLPEFADYIEYLNLRYELKNTLELLRSISELIQNPVSMHAETIAAERLQQSAELLLAARNNFSIIAQQLQEEESALSNLRFPDNGTLRNLQNDHTPLQTTALFTSLQKLFFGFPESLLALETAAREIGKRKIIIATHMHAGDGNVHVNIPVHSSDYQMMQDADEAAGLAMRAAVTLGGVVSGEHGIGLTKLKFIDRSILQEYQEYKAGADPHNIFNPGKLDSRFPLHLVYTPSFNLLECEALILESTELEKLNASVASCVRCGKCKPVCNTHAPKQGLLYNPRNKILSVGMITEAILYSAQTMDMKSFLQFKNMREIADHCTVCHKCAVPCPVKIDFGKVTLNIRQLLLHRKKSAFKPFTSSALFYLGRKKFMINKAMRIALLGGGYSAQRVAARINRPIAAITCKALPKISRMLEVPFPKSGGASVREQFDLKQYDAAYCFEKQGVGSDKGVVYFPGCGSERMFPDLSFAVIALLYHAGIKVLIPPEYVCCGYPYLANGEQDKAALKAYENRVMFHRIADNADYLNINGIIVSCGTCLDMLSSYELNSVFPESSLLDIHEYLIRENLYTGAVLPSGSITYHEPCHSPLKQYGIQQAAKHLFQAAVSTIPECCGEAGTLALSRPDISHQLKNRKIEAVASVLQNGGEIFTTCPSCISGLCKLNVPKKVTGKALVVQVAETYLGMNWKRDFINSALADGVQRMIL